MKNIPGLKHWAARQAAEYTADNLAKLATLDRDEVVQLVRQAPFVSKPDGASAVGDIVHEWVDAYIKGEHRGMADQPRAAQGMVRAFLKFAETYNPEWFRSEFTVWSESYQYAGTADWAAKIHGWLVLGDTKTGKSVYSDTVLQLAALANADFILEDDGTEVELPRFDRFAVLHLRPTYYELLPFIHIPEAFEAFKALRRVFEFQMAHSGNCMMWAPKVEVRAA
jgi:hypothetical protein